MPQILARKIERNICCLKILAADMSDTCHALHEIELIVDNTLETHANNILTASDSRALSLSQVTESYIMKSTLK